MSASGRPALRGPPLSRTCCSSRRGETSSARLFNSCRWGSLREGRCRCLRESSSRRRAGQCTHPCPPRSSCHNCPSPAANLRAGMSRAAQGPAPSRVPRSTAVCGWHTRAGALTGIIRASGLAVDDGAVVGVGALGRAGRLARRADAEFRTCSRQPWLRKVHEATAHAHGVRPGNEAYQYRWHRSTARKCPRACPLCTAANPRTWVGPNCTRRLQVTERPALSGSSACSIMFRALVKE